MRAVMVAVRVTEDRPARFVIAPGTAVRLPAFRVEVLGAYREVSFENCPLAQAYPMALTREGGQ